MTSRTTATMRRTATALVVPVVLVVGVSSAPVAAEPGGTGSSAGSSVPESPVTMFISEEITTGTATCSTGTMAVRSAVDAQRGPWADAAGAQGRTLLGTAELPVPSDPNRVNEHPTTMSFPELVVDGSPVEMTVSLRNVAPSSIPPHGGAAGDPDVGSLPTGSSYRAPYTPVPSNGTLQDCAPYPQSLHATHPDNDGHARQWNEVGGSSTLLNAVLFDFDIPVGAFGAWFGDLETRLETPAWYKLFGADGWVLDEGPIPTSTADPSDLTCGLGQRGCGNRSTRWVGFTSDQPVASMLVVVGDDDSCDQVGPAQCAGLTEHISWIGATVAVAPPSLQIAKTVVDATAVPEGEAEWEITVSNTGEVDLTGVAVHDVPGEGIELTGLSGVGWDCSVELPTTCTVDRLPPGPAPVIRVSSRVDAAPGTQQLTNSATSTADGVPHATAAAWMDLEPAAPPPVDGPPVLDAPSDLPPSGTGETAGPAGPQLTGAVGTAFGSLDGVDAAMVPTAEPERSAADDTASGSPLAADELARTGRRTTPPLVLGAVLSLIGTAIVMLTIVAERRRSSAPLQRSGSGRR